MSAFPYDRSRVTILNHPLVQHRVAELRAKGTGSARFRELVRELSMMEAYEATRDVPTERVTVRTPLMETSGSRFTDGQFVIVTILRAGIGMLNGTLTMLPTAAVGVLGMERNEQTHEPREYYAKMPKGIENKTVLLVDPMLATGGSALAAVKYLRKLGVKDLRALFIIAAPQGAQTLLEADPDIRIWTCAMDDGLNESAYILPGLGDAGDRLFGTV